MSRAERRAIAAISMTSGVAVELINYYRDLPGRQQIKGLLQRLDQACRAALSEFNGQLTKREVDELLKQIKIVERRLYKFGSHGPVVAVSLVMGAINGVHGRVQNPMRKAVLNDVLDRLMGVLKYYDRKLDRSTDYEIATEGLNIWEREWEAS